MDFREIRQLAEGRGIAQGDEGDAVVSEGRQACNSRGLLTTTMATSGDEHASVLALQLALLPQLAGGIPECLQDGISPLPTKMKGEIWIYAHLPLSGEVTVASGDTENEAIKVTEVVGTKDRIVGLGGRMHFGQNLLRKSLGDPRMKSRQSRNAQSL